MSEPTYREAMLRFEIAVLREALRRVSPLHASTPVRVLAVGYGITPPEPPTVPG